MGREKKSKHRRDRSRSDSRSRDRDRKRRHSSSSNDSSSDDSDRRIDAKLKEQRKQKKLEKKLEKQRMKDNETSEEKKARRMEKKREKDKKRKAQSQDESLIPPELAYTNLNNPFNDTKLTETFVWGKKLDKEGKGQMTERQIQKETSRRIQKNLHEASEFKRVRDARMAAREDMDMIRRDENLRESSMSFSKEREFSMNLVKERTRIRIEQGRAKAIDVLTRYIRFNDVSEDASKEEEFELEDPITSIKSNCKSVEDLEDLLEDIKTYQELESTKVNSETWSDIKVIVNDELSKRVSQDRGDVHSSVKQEVTQLFKDKSIDELLKLENQIVEKQNSNSGNKGYWQNLHEQLTVFIARKRLREYHGKMLRLKLARIREEQMKEVQSVEKMAVSEVQSKKEVKDEEDEGSHDDGDGEDNEKLSKKVRRKVNIAELDDAELDEMQREHKWKALTVDQLEEVTLEFYNLGNYSPPYNSFDDTMPGIEIIDAQADVENLMEKREANRKKPEDMKDAGEAKMLAIARKGMEGDEATFSVEEQLETQKYLWSDKYRPRKPTYLNRVQTGFDWNKYNQTHYDMDNPPPKIVQGYKFNVFYPDLLDATRTPTFRVIPCDDQDFAVIRFKAGPPYEDIAFKVVNREWEILHKNGYKCQFQNGVFQLWFMFKKYRYRR